MIDVKEAVRLAEKYLAELSSQGGILFEEVEPGQDVRGCDRWLVTLSIPTPGSVLNSNGPPLRDYKVVAIGPDGSLESVKIRKL
jgi:hypothetical protein